MNEKAIEKLRNEILKQAACDYSNALRNENQKAINELENFFQSDWFSFLTLNRIHGDYIIRLIRSSVSANSKEEKRKHYFQKLSYDSAKIIRNEYKNGTPVKILAEKYNVSQSLIRMVLRNEIWV